MTLGTKLAVGLALAGWFTMLPMVRPSAPSPRGAQSSHVNGAEPNPTRGKRLFQQNCAICHFSTSTAKKIGPGLKGLNARGRDLNGRKIDDTSLRRWIEEGDRRMEGFRGRLKPDDIRDLIAYLKTL